MFTEKVNRLFKDLSNIVIKTRGFQDEMATTAILDRLFHKAHIFNIDGQSYRLKDFNKMIQESQKEKS